MKTSNKNMAPSNNNNVANRSSASFADQQWNRAAEMLKTNPSLVTYHILCMALKHRPPLQIVKYMLQLNPKAASVPKNGPTPLQVAVQHSCSVEIVRTLIEACPFALVATNPGSHLDPLSYAKRFRSDEPELIQLLSTPLNHWIPDSIAQPPADAPAVASATGDDNSSTSTNNASNQTHTRAKAATVTPSNKPPSPPATLRQRLLMQPPAFDLCVGPVPLGASSPAKTMAATKTKTAWPASKSPTPSLVDETTSEVNGPSTHPKTVASLQPQPQSSSAVVQQDRQELMNVKHLCLAVVKGHKRLSRELKSLADQDWLQQLQQQNDKQFQVHKVALDMKERAVQGQLRRAQEQIQANLQAHMESMAQGAHLIQPLETKLAHLTTLVQTQMQDLQHRVVAMEQTFQGKLEQLEQKHEFRQWELQQQQPQQSKFSASFWSEEEEASPRATQIVAWNHHKNERRSTTPPTVITASSSTIETVTLPSDRPVHKKKNKRSKKKQTVNDDPIVFCSPIHVGADDEVRSLLSDDSGDLDSAVVHFDRCDQQQRHGHQRHNPLHCLLLLMHPKRNDSNRLGSN